MYLKWETFFVFPLVWMECLDKLVWPLDKSLFLTLTRVRALNALTSVKGNWKLTRSLMGNGESEQRLFCGKWYWNWKQNLYGSPVNFSKTPAKIVPVNDVNSVCRVCVGLCPGAADSPCKCEKFVNVKHNLLKPSKEDTRGKLSSLLRSEVRPSTELSHNNMLQV